MGDSGFHEANQNWIDVDEDYGFFQCVLCETDFPTEGHLHVHCRTSDRHGVAVWCGKLD